MPEAWFLSFLSEKTPIKYNPHPVNPDLYAYDFTTGGKTIRFCYGPGPTGDLVYEDGALIFMQKLRQRGVSVQDFRINIQNHYSDHKKGKTRPEHLRVCKMLKYTEEHPEELKMLSLAFDTKAREMGKEYTDGPETGLDYLGPLFYRLARHYPHPEDPRGFGEDEAVDLARDFESLLQKVDEDDGLKAFQTMHHDGKDNGWWIPEEVLSSKGVTRAFRQTKALFTEYLRRDHDYAVETVKEKKELGQTALLTIEGMISLKALLQTFEGVPTDADLRQFAGQRLDADLLASRTFGHCKQDIDRAIVNNIVLRLMFRTLTDAEALSADEFHEIVGGVLARARIVDGRNIQLKRYKHLSNFLKFFGHPQKVLLLQEHLLALIQ